MGHTRWVATAHFRTTVDGVGQVEIDDLYIGIDTDGHRAEIAYALGLDEEER